MARYVLVFEEIHPAQVGVVGGKGLHLAELSRIEGVRVPPGFCVTTNAFHQIAAEDPSMEDLLDRLALVDADDREALHSLSGDIRRVLEAVAVPDDMAAEIAGEHARLGEEVAYAVRSSATAEDSPTTSFAGQHDTYLNVVGLSAILRDVTRCWASLFTERAVSYRLRNGIDHREVQMAVVIQQMVFPGSAGVLFTADPVTSNRTVSSVEAVFGLGDALVSGQVNADVYKVRNDEIVAKEIATKRHAFHAAPGGGTHKETVEATRHAKPALTDADVVRLVSLGRRIEAHFGQPQDIEWCLVDDDFQIVQSRPITTLFPVPATDDDENHVYVSVGHQQMMTDAIKPLGISMWQLTALRSMYEAGARLFVDVTMGLASPVSRTGLLDMIEKGDPLIRDALETILERDDFIPSLPDKEQPKRHGGGPPKPIETDPAIVTGLIERSRASIASLQRDIGKKSGTDLFDLILSDIEELRGWLSDPLNMQAIMAGMEATWWLNEKLEAWLGEKNAADTLTLSAPNNVTSEMGLALLDVADVIRPYPEVIAFLQDVEDDGFVDELAKVPGGQQTRDAIANYLDTYGMRCVGEIDITRPRWSERPTALLPVILDHLEHLAPGARERRFEKGRREAEAKKQDVLERVRRLPDGEQRAEEAERMIDRVRTFIGYREYPKYAIVNRYFIYKRALLKEAEDLVRARVIGEPEDIFYLTFQELEDVVRTRHVDEHLIERRKHQFSSYRALSPPRVLTSDGEALNGAYRRDDLPADALVGLGVSTGIVEGRARIILDMSEADIEPGDILVTTHTDPSWSPLFVTVAGLVAEVGGQMTHGAVVAREYGLPAVVGLDHATQKIQDGQLIRVHGTDGYVEILQQAARS